MKFGQYLAKMWTRV